MTTVPTAEILGLRNGVAIVKQDAAQGRFVIAAMDIPAGTQIQKCALYAHGIAESYKKRVCANCLAVANAGVFALSCRHCQQAYVCSQRCLAQLVAGGHHLVCGALRRIATFKTSPHRKAIMRIIVHVLLRRALEASRLAFVPASPSLLRDCVPLSSRGMGWIDSFNMIEGENNVNCTDNDIAFLDNPTPKRAEQSPSRPTLSTSKSPARSLIGSGRSLQEMVQEKLRLAGGLPSRQSSSASIVSRPASASSIPNASTSTTTIGTTTHSSLIGSLPITSSINPTKDVIRSNSTTSSVSISTVTTTTTAAAIPGNTTTIASDIVPTNTIVGSNGITTIGNTQMMETPMSTPSLAVVPNEINSSITTELTSVTPTYELIQLLQSHLSEWQFDSTKDWRKTLGFVLTLLHGADLATAQEMDGTVDGSGAMESNFVLNLISQVESNSFGIWSNKGVCMGHALFPAASFYNHSCAPNCSVDQTRDEMVITTTRVVPRGTALTISYVDTDQPLRTRRSKLRADYYFVCCCARCTQEEAGGSTISLATSTTTTNTTKGSNSTDRNDSNVLSGTSSTSPDMIQDVSNIEVDVTTLDANATMRSSNSGTTRTMGRDPLAYMRPFGS